MPYFIGLLIAIKLAVYFLFCRMLYKFGPRTKCGDEYTEAQRLLEKQQNDLQSYLTRMTLYFDVLAKVRSVESEGAKLEATKSMVKSFVASADFYLKKWQNQLNVLKKDHPDIVDKPSGVALQQLEEMPQSLLAAQSLLAEALATA